MASMSSKTILCLAWALTSASAVNGQTLFNCTFSSGWCSGMTYNNRWTAATRGTTPSVGTGPTVGQGSLSPDNYAFLETSVNSQYTDQVSRFSTSNFTVPSGGAYVQFYYHMFGSSIGNLTVAGCNSTVCTALWVLAGQQQVTQTSAWRVARVALNSSMTSVQFWGDRGRTSTWQGDIAVDSILVTTGTRPPTSAPTPRPACTATGTIVVTSSSPQQSCIPTATAGPNTTDNTCYSTRNGTCFTDGAGNHGNSELCTVKFTQSGRLYARGAFTAEACCDYFTHSANPTTRIQSASVVNSTFVAADSTLTWYTDASVTTAGFEICLDTSGTASPTTAAPVSQLPWTCDFNYPSTGAVVPNPPTSNGVRNMCGMSHNNLWTTTGNHTSTAVTGPVYGQGGFNDTYAYIESTNGVNGMLSVLTTPGLNIGSNGGQLIFYYHMYGSSIGTLTVEQCTQAMVCTSVFTQSGQQHASQWANWTRTTAALNSTTKFVRFKATKGATIYGDIAIDSITIVDGSTLPPTTVAPTLATCPNQAPTSTAFFRVTASYPIQTCRYPNTDTTGSCYVHNNGTCFTDGEGNHGNQERCDFEVLQDGYLNVNGTFQLESCTPACDYIVVGNSTTQHVSSSTLQRMRITRGQIIRFTSDWGLNTAGFDICATASQPSAAPTPAALAGTWTCAFDSPSTGTAQPTTLPTSIGVRNYCGMSHSGLWRVSTGATTPSLNTGPASGQGGSTDPFLHIEASTGSTVNSTLTTPQFSPMARGILSFYYHMYGATIGSLHVQACTNTSNCTILWSQTGQQHTSQLAAWTYAQVTLPLNCVNVSFIGVKGRSFTGDISVDTISISTDATFPPSVAPTNTPNCDAAVSGAAFKVVASNPEIGCTGGGGPNSDATGSACYITDGGLCFTDGPGDYRNYETCTVNVLTSGFLNTTNFSLGTGDYFRSGTSTTRLATNASMFWLPVTAGQNLTFTSSTSGVGAGYKICMSPPQPALTSFSCYFDTAACRMHVGGLWTTTPATGRGPTLSQTGDNNNYVRINTAGTVAAGVTNNLTTPLLDLSSGSGGQLLFWYHMFGGSSLGTLTLFTCSGSTAGTTCTSVWNQTGASQSNAGSPWLPKNISLPSGTTSVVWSVVRGTTVTGGIAIDSIVIVPGSTLPPTVAPTATPACPAQASGALFRVTDGSIPPNECAGAGGPQTNAQGPCYVFNGGTCFTSGPGHGNNERCTVQVVSSSTVYLYAPSTFQTESCCDWLNVTGSSTRLTNSAQFNGLALSANSQISWRSDYSVTTAGFTVCASTTTPPTTACSASSGQEFFKVTSSSPVQTCQNGAGPTSGSEGTCYTTASGSCISDVPGNNARCTIEVLRSGVLVVQRLNVERCCDYFTFAGTRRNTVAQLDNFAITTGDTFTWYSDYSIFSTQSWLICATQPTIAPTATSAPSTLPPTAVPTTTPTAAPTSSPTAFPTTMSPTMAPTARPTTTPTSLSPTNTPTSMSPTRSPSARPTMFPSFGIPTTFQPTNSLAPTGGTGASNSNSGGGDNMLLIVVALIAIAVIAVVVAVLYSKRGGGGAAPANPDRVAAFDNPIYNNAEQGMIGGVGGESSTDGGYMDVDHGGAEEEF